MLLRVLAEFGFTVCATILAARSLGAYSVEMNTSSDFPAGITTLAIMPIGCPPKIDCSAVERDLAEYLGHYKARFSVVSAGAVRQATFDMGLLQPDDSRRQELMSRLKADAALLVVVGHAGTEQSGAVTFPVFNTLFTGFVQESSGNVTMFIVSADGKPLMRGTGFGKSEWYGDSSLVSRLCQDVLDKAFARRPISAETPPVPAPPGTMLMSVRCTACKSPFWLQANLGKHQELAQQCLSFPLDNKFVCPKCGQAIDLTELRAQIEKQAGKRIE